MRVMMLVMYSPAKGQRLERGAVVEVENEVALDLIQRGVAKPVAEPVERAVGVAQRG